VCVSVSHDLISLSIEDSALLARGSCGRRREEVADFLLEELARIAACRRVPSSRPTRPGCPARTSGSSPASVTNNDLWIAAAAWGAAFFVTGIVFFWQAESKYGRG